MHITQKQIKSPTLLASSTQFRTSTTLISLVPSKTNNKNQSFLSQLKINQRAKIISILNLDENLKLRLLELGLVKDTIIKIKKISPLKDPIDIEIRGYELCLRLNEAKNILVEIIK